MRDVLRLLKAVNELRELLEDPHPGLYTWNKMVGDKIAEIGEFGGLAWRRRDD